MKRLLKLLGVVALTTPLSVSIVACGSTDDSGNEVSENNNVQDLLIKAKEQINLGLGDLIQQYKNLTFEDEFDLGKDITTALNALPNDSDTEINNVIKSLFLNRLQEDINNFVIDKYLLQPPELKPLFGNIAANQILKIDINQTVLTKTVFNWDKSVDFGIAGYDPITYKITMWHKLATQLKLVLTYKNESNINSPIEIDDSYIFNYANPGANIQGLVDASTTNVETALKDYIVELKNTIVTDNDWVTKIKILLLAKINNTKVNINNVTTEGLTNLTKNDRYASGQYMYQAVIKPTVAEAVSSLKTYLTPVATKFATKVINWIRTGSSAKLITVNKDNINSFGACTINDWNISGLTLKPMTLDFLNARTDQTQVEWAEQTATALCTIFCAKGAFAQDRIDLASDDNLTMYMNPGDFDDYVNTDKKMSDISDYISLKIDTKAKAEHIIKNGLRTILNGLWKKNPNLSNRDIVEKVDDKTFKIAKNAGGMHGYNYLTIYYESTVFLTGANKNSKSDYILFNNWIVKKADTDVW